MTQRKQQRCRSHTTRDNEMERTGVDLMRFSYRKINVLYLVLAENLTNQNGLIRSETNAKPFTPSNPKA